MINWLEMLYNFADKTPNPSVKYSFINRQTLEFGMWQLQENMKIHHSGKVGHKNKGIKPKPQIRADLDCDDPLYDEQPVF